MIFIREICNEYAERIAKAKENGRKLAIEHATLIAEKIREEFFKGADDFELVIYATTCYMRDIWENSYLTVLELSLVETDKEMIFEEREEFRNAYIEQLCEELPELANASMIMSDPEGKFVVTFGRDFIINFNGLQEVYNKLVAEGTAN